MRLGKLVNTLLDFSRLQAGRIDARFEPVDLAEATAELASVFRSAVDRAGLDFTVDCPPLDQAVHIDRDMWEKVVLNLLSNALKFTFSGGITVRLRQVDGGAQLTVSDTGSGIPAEELPRLFERFHRVANARSRSGEGSGIGLAMVRELVTAPRRDDRGGEHPRRRHHLHRHPAVRFGAPAGRPAGAAVAGGRRACPPGPSRSSPRRCAGSPVSDDGAIAPAPKASAPSTRPRRGRPGAGRVLVADDNADMREYLQRLLAPHYSVASVSDGQAALDAALADPPDLVVSDVMMPGLDGMQLLAALRGDERTSRVPVVLLSARAGQQAAVEGLAAGADDYLVKPFSAQELLARVSAHLSLGRARRAAEEQFTAMADLAPALIWVADPDGRRVFVNQGWAQFTGRPVGEELDRGWEDRLHPEDELRYRADGGRGRPSGARAGRSSSGCGAATAPTTGCWSGRSRSARGRAFAGYVGSCTDINARFLETERQMLLAEVGAALDLEIGRRGAADRPGPADRARAGWPSSAGWPWSATTDGSGSSGWRVPMPRPSDVIAAWIRNRGSVLDGGRQWALGALQQYLPDDHPAATDPQLSRPVAVGSAMAVPMIVRGRVMAVLGMGRRGDAPPFHDDDRGLAEEMAARAALAVDNAMLLADERAAAHRLALLQRATAELSAATTPAEVALVAAEHIRQLTGPDSRVAVYEVDASHRALAALTISGGSRGEPPPVGRAAAVGAGHRRATAVVERRPSGSRTSRQRPAVRAGPAAGAGRLDQGVRPGGQRRRCR